MFVGQDTVWKLRKAVALPFLDFSTAAERRRTALREVELTAPHAPGLYRDVVPVRRGPQGLALGGAGEAIDWVVRMARVPGADFLDVIASRGGLTPALLDQLGDTVAACHAKLAPVHRNHAQALRKVASGNRVAALTAGLPAAAVETWHHDIQAAIDARAAWLEARTQGGFVRRAHGDLHLGNLCLWQGRPAPFDALEFDEDMATIDLGYDLAFLLMDLERRAGRPAANRVLNRYVARTGDVDLVAGLPVFLSLRALVRAHVQARSGLDAAPYLAMAQAVLHPPPARAMAIGGLQGTGKTTLARRIAPLIGPSPGALVLRSDEIRKRRCGVAPEQRLPASAYAEEVSRAVLAELCAGVRNATRSGQAVIADATFMNPRDRDAVAAAARAPFQGVWLDAPLEVLASRVRARVGDASDADEAVLGRAAQADLGVITWTRLDAADALVLDRFVENITKPALSC